jgi:hypothetical protein
VFSRLDEIGSHQFLFHQVLRAFDGRQEVPELALYAEHLGENLASHYTSVFERAFMHGIHAFPNGIGDFREIERHYPAVSLYDSRDRGDFGHC